MIPMILKISDSSYSSSPQTFLRKLMILTWNISWNSGSLFLSSSWSISKFSRRHMTGLFLLSSKPLKGAMQQYSGEFLLLPSTIPLLVIYFRACFCLGFRAFLLWHSMKQRRVKIDPFNILIWLYGIVKFMFSKKVAKIDEIFTVDLTLCSKCQIDGEYFVNFCGLLRKHEL